ncbi:MAG: hypothetical protein ABEH43_03615, partial [Flavobacteriales bacterium]
MKNKLPYSKSFTISILRILLVILFLIPAFNIKSQQNNNCGKIEDNKIKDWLEEAQDESYRDRIELMKKAVEREKECAECLYILGHTYFKMAKNGRLSYKNSEKYLKKLMEVCPKYHSGTWFKLGVINYRKENYQKALKYFKGFLDYDQEGDDKYEKDYVKKYEDTKGMIEEIEFYAKFYGDTLDYDPKRLKGVSSRRAGEYLPMLSPDNRLI